MPQVTKLTGRVITPGKADNNTANQVGVPNAFVYILRNNNPAELPTRVLLFYPAALALGPRSVKSPDGRRVAPDETIPNTSGADVRAGRDAQLDAAVAWVVKQR